MGSDFEIDDKEKKALDDAEGLGYGYNETRLTVQDDDNHDQVVQVYVADPGAVNNNLCPFDWYKDFIVSGAESNDLPANYVNKLKQLPALKDKDEERRKKL